MLRTGGKSGFTLAYRARSGPASNTAAQDVTLTISAIGKKRKKLNSKGKAGTSVSVTFTPTSGTANAQSVNATLRKKLKK